MEVKKTLGCKIVFISELKLAENFDKDNLIYQNLLKEKVIEIKVNGLKPNFYYFELYYSDINKPILKLKYDESDFEKKKLFENIKCLVLKYIYYNKMRTNFIYAIIKSYAESPSRFIDSYLVTCELYDNFETKIYISKYSFNFFKFKIGDKVFIKRNDQNNYKFDKESQLANTL